MYAQMQHALELDVGPTSPSHLEDAIHLYCELRDISQRYVAASRGLPRIYVDTTQRNLIRQECVRRRDCFIDVKGAPEALNNQLLLLGHRNLAMINYD